MLAAQEVAPREFDDLAKTLPRGELVYPEDVAYATATHTWNAQAKIGKSPKVVVRARGPGDVVAAVKYAAEKKMPLSVKAGGHSMTCLSNGIVIDLSLMRGIRVDAEKRIARVEAGCLLGDLDAELAAFNLIVPAGVVSHTGVAGLTLGGGVGYLGRSLGLTCDHIISVDIVTADGQLRVASKTENSDLFWAVRGAGANFGVVTSFEFRCDPFSGTVFAGPTMFPFPRLAEVGKKLVEVTSSPDFPNEAHLNLVIGHGPSGHPGAILLTVYNGSADKGAELIKPFTDLEPVMQKVGEVPFTVLQKSTDPMVPHGRHYYQSGIFLDILNEDVINILAKHYAASPSPMSVMMVETQGGKISELPYDECAVSWRKAQWCVNVVGAWEKEEDEEKNKAWVRAVAAELKPYKSDTTYVNMFSIPQEEKDKVPLTEYWGTHAVRLQQLKQKWDPNNVFRAQVNLFRESASS